MIEDFGFEFSTAVQSTSFGSSARSVDYRPNSAASSVETEGESKAKVIKRLIFMEKMIVLTFVNIIDVGR
jgi:hypothetical protein